MARPTKKAVAVKTLRKQRSEKGVKRKSQAEKLAAAAAQEQNEAMVARALEVPLEEQVVNLRRERNRYFDRASNAEGALRRELNYHQLRVEEINVLLELNDLRYD